MRGRHERAGLTHPPMLRHHPESAPLARSAHDGGLFSVMLGFVEFQQHGYMLEGRIDFCVEMFFKAIDAIVNTLAEIVDAL